MWPTEDAAFRLRNGPPFCSFKYWFNDLIFICRRHGYDASPTSRFFFGFCRSTAGYTSNMPVDTDNDAEV